MPGFVPPRRPVPATGPVTLTAGLRSRRPARGNTVCVGPRSTLSVSLGAPPIAVVGPARALCAVWVNEVDALNGFRRPQLGLSAETCP